MDNKSQPVSIVIPTLNEAGSIPSLLARIDSTMTEARIPYEVIIVDDKSTDRTRVIANNLKPLYPLTVVTKQGKRGKAYSLLEGFKLANYPIIAMIDADLQYPPEELAPMNQLLTQTDADLIVTRRTAKKIPVLRKVSTKIFNLIFARLLFGITFDTQSGLKMFRKSILSSFEMQPSPWSFDLEFIVRATEHKYKIASHDIPFDERLHGETKVSLISTTFELAKASLGLKKRTSSSRIREGLQANSRFLKKTMALLITVVSAAALSLAFIKPASALELPISSLDTFSPVLGQQTKVLDTVSGLLLPSTPNTPTPIQTQPTPQAQDSITSQITNVPKNGTTPTTDTAQPSSAGTTSSSSEAISNPQANVAQWNSTGSSSRNAEILIPKTGTTSPNRSSLSAPTATNKPSNAYASGYPSYIFSPAVTNAMYNGARIALLAGTACAISAIVLLRRPMSIFNHNVISQD